MALAPQTEQAADSRKLAGVDVQVSVVVPCRNEAAYVAGMLDALRAQDCAIDDVIIVDGGSADGTMDVVREYGARHPDFRLRVVTAYGANIPAALNAGILASQSDVIVRMDSHSRPAADYVRRVLLALDETDAAVVGGVWQISPGAPGAVALAIAKAVAHPMGAGDAAYRLGGGREHERRRVDTVPFGGFRRSHWRQIGGYNEQLLVNEDYEFNYRTRLDGGSVVLDTAITCEYFARASLTALAQQYFRYGWWKGRMLRQHPQSIRIRQAVPALFLPVWLLLGVVAALVPIARPVVALLLAGYVAALIAAAIHAGARQWRLVVPLAAAFATIHSAWSAGISSFLLTGASALSRRQPGGRRPRAGLTGVQLGFALAVIFLLSVVLPWSMASRVHRERIDRASAEVNAIAAALQADSAARQVGYQSDTILVGPGGNPEIPPGSDWRQITAINAATVLVDLHLAPDPWGNHYLIYPSPAGQDALHRAGMARWVLSAGPNGIVDTPYRQKSGSRRARRRRHRRSRALIDVVPDRPRRGWRTARSWVGVAAAGAALYACAVHIQWADVAEAFRGASVSLTGAAAVSVLLTLALVTLRWRLLVDPGATADRWRILWDSVVLGQAVNIIVPLRFGEGVRLAVTCRGLGVPLGRVMVGLALERAFDLAAFAVIVATLVVSGWMPRAAGGRLPAAVALTLVAMAAAVLVGRCLPEVLAWLRRHVGVLAPAASWIETQEAAMRGGWAEVSRGNRLTMIGFFTALIPVTAAATNLLVLRSFNLPVPAITALVLLVVLQIGTAVVSVPGNIGVFHYLTVVTLAAWGVSRPAAMAAAIVLHVVSLGPKVLLGALTTTVWRGSLSDTWLAARSRS